ncbi:MAG: signal peptidase I, partial [Nitrospira sp.]|nr:signal peptidase I [Nitrospira sp.]
MSLDPNPRPDEMSSTTEPAPSTTPPEPAPGDAHIVTAAQPAHKSILREYAEAIIIAMLLAFAIRVFVVQAFKIPSGSMIPTLLVGDHILVSKLSYGLQWPADCKFQPGFPPVTCYSSRTLIPFGSIQRGDI